MTSNPPDMKIRISTALRQRIEKAAKANNRTMNGEIVARLEKSFETEDVASDARSKTALKRLMMIGTPGAEQLEGHEKRIAELEIRVAALEGRTRGNG